MFRRKRTGVSGELVAVPIEQMDEWVAGVINPAWEKASGGATPEQVNVLAKIALDAICGRERAELMAPSRKFLDLRR